MDVNASNYDSEAEVPDDGEFLISKQLTARHRVEYHPGTRLASSAEVDLVGHDDSVRTIKMTPVLKFMMKGLGYTHPEWRQGSWQGELEIGHESFDPRQLDPLAAENIHNQQVVKVTDGEREGIGVMEQIFFGPYTPSGFNGILDGYQTK